MTTPAAAAKKQQTAYHVFREEQDSSGGKAYIPIDANVTAANGKAAVKATAKQNGIYVAIPVKSFQPVKVKVEQTTTIKLG